jgi:D-alanyl-lipoteichoic acid acyltransferase DltB (MBOAT superfamily)
MTRPTLRNSGFELTFLLLVLLAGGASLKAGLGMPSSPWEAIGRGAFPTALGVLALGLGALKLLEMLLREADSEAPAPGLPWRIPASFALMAAYVALLALDVVHYVTVTGLFSFLYFLLLAPVRPARAIAALALLSAGYALVVYVIFTRFFFINL